MYRTTRAFTCFTLTRTLVGKSPPFCRQSSPVVATHRLSLYRCSIFKTTTPSGFAPRACEIWPKPSAAKSEITLPPLAPSTPRAATRLRLPSPSCSARLSAFLSITCTSDSARSSHFHHCPWLSISKSGCGPADSSPRSSGDAAKIAVSGRMGREV